MSSGFLPRDILATLSIFCACTAAPAEGIKINFDKNSRSIHVPLNKKSVEIFPAFEDYSFMMFDVCEALGLKIDRTNKNNCVIFPMNAEIGGNAVALESRGEKLIIYDRILSKNIGYEGAQGIIAHEVGHHYCGHIGSQKNSHEIELEADQIIGATFKRMKFELKDALALAPVLDSRPSPSHPSKDDRIKAISNGYANPEMALSCKLIN